MSRQLAGRDSEADVFTDTDMRDELFVPHEADIYKSLFREFQKLK